MARLKFLRADCLLSNEAGRGERSVSGTQIFQPEREDTMRRRDRHRPETKVTFESLEERIALSADALTSGVPGALQHHAELDLPVHHDTQIEASLASTNQSSGVQQIHNEYGFDGAGQTVVVIDSGIAWDHYALGGGYGNGHRVVGGWDFAENDADPYDDGPAGFHGTHVAGIIGSSDSVHRGVAHEVDLVALRVFDDQGNGRLQWVEQALQWAYQNRDSFENPITTINLSLGVEMNVNSTPFWATLEDEFAALKAEGIFISVSAGNSFQTYQDTGLGYPAVSEHVVPVASHGSDGQLSSFSQRNNRVIAAPGESIRSTVPDHLFGNSQTGQFLSASGTSMAAPYLAGASALLREAMEFMGQQGITQDTLYNHFRQTADLVFDSVTNSNYHRLNLTQAISSVVTDSHGDTLGTATSLTTLVTQQTVSGTLGTVSDIDSFQFTAGHSGTVTLSLDVTHDLSPEIRINGSVVQVQNNQVQFDVQAGGNYSFQITTTNGIGHYDATLQLDAIAGPVDLGNVAFAHQADQGVSGERWYQVTTTRQGLLTAMVSATPLTVEVYDAANQQIATGSVQDGVMRVDANVAANTQYQIRVVGNQSSFDFSVANLVGLSNGHLQVAGTTGQDTFQIDATDQYAVSIQTAQNHTVSYRFTQADVQQVTLQENGGSDTLQLTLGAHDDNVSVSAGSVSVTNSAYTFAASSLGDITINAGGGTDHIVMSGVSGQVDQFQFASGTSSLTNQTRTVTASLFEHIAATANDFSDTASLAGSNGNDTFEISRERTRLLTSTHTAQVDGFRSVQLNGQGGRDAASIQGSQANDYVMLVGSYGNIWLSGVRIVANGIADKTVDGGGGYDTIRLFDTAGDEQLSANRARVQLTDGSYRNEASGFEQILAYEGNAGGTDTADVAGDHRNDAFTATQRTLGWTNDQFALTLNDFTQINLNGHGGTDSLDVEGSEHRDFVTQTGTYANIWIAGTRVIVNGVENKTVEGRGGNDTARFYDTNSDDVFTGSRDSSVMTDGVYRNEVSGFEEVFAYGHNATGNDQAILNDSNENDQLLATPTQNSLVGSTYRIDTSGFEQVSVNSTNGGIDTAQFTGTTENESLVSQGNQTIISGLAFQTSITGFGSTHVLGNGGNDTAVLQGTSENNQFTFSEQTAQIAGSNFQLTSQGFGKINFQGGGGQNTVNLSGFDENDRLEAAGDALNAYLDGTEIEANQFIWMESSTDQNAISRQEVDAVDFWYALHGDWE